MYDFGFNSISYLFNVNNWLDPIFTYNPFGNFNFFSFQFPTDISLFDYTNFFNDNSYAEKSVPDLTQQLKLENPTDNIKPKSMSEKSLLRNSSLLSNNNDLKSKGYNAKAGQKLAQTALKNSVGWKGYCATYVKNAIQESNLGEYKKGHAYQMPEILRNNKNFKEISPDTVDVKDLPAGCVLVYGKGKQGYNKSYGHTEITTGDGRAVSDGITKNLYKKPTAVFIPVEHNYIA